MFAALYDMRRGVKKIMEVIGMKMGMSALKTTAYSLFPKCLFLCLCPDHRDGICMSRANVPAILSLHYVTCS